MKPPLIGVCIINFHQPKLTLICLDSLAKQTHKSFKVFLIDNETNGEFSHQELNRYPFVNYHTKTTNTGFAQGNNIAINQALKYGCDYIILLNNDTKVTSDFLEKFVFYAKQQSPIDLLGCNIVYLKHPKTLWFAGGILYQPLLLTQHFMMNQPAGKTKRLPDLRHTDWITGCVMGMKKEFFQKIGFFDETFFAYLEDVDLCLRAKNRGGKCLIINQALVKHAVSPTIGISGSNHFTQLKLKFLAKNTAKIIRKHYPQKTNILLPLNILLQSTIYLVQRRIKITQIPYFIAQFRLQSTPPMPLETSS